MALGDILRGAAQELPQVFSGLQNNLEREHLAKVYSANPQFALGLQQLQSGVDQQQQQRAEIERQQRQREALKQLAPQFRTGGINPEALAEYAGITGDISPLLKLQSGGNKTANIKEFERAQEDPEFAQFLQGRDSLGRSIARLMAENPNLTQQQAMAMAKGLSSKGLQIDDSGNVTPISGLTESLSSVEQAKAEGGLKADLTYKPEIEAQTATAASNAKFMEEGRQKLPKMQRSLQSALDRNTFMNEKSKNIIAKSNALTTGFTGAISKQVAGSEAFDLAQDLKTFLADAGFSRLQEMRDNSPSGGALGNVTEKELELLQAAEQNLLQSQSKEQFDKNFETFIKQRNLTLQRIQEAYEQDWNRFNGSKDVNLPAPSETVRPDMSEPPKLPEEAHKDSVRKRQGEIGTNQFQRDDLKNMTDEDILRALTDG